MPWLPGLVAASAFPPRAMDKGDKCAAHVGQPFAHRAEIDAAAPSAHQGGPPGGNLQVGPDDRHSYGVTGRPRRGGVRGGAVDVHRRPHSSVPGPGRCPGPGKPGNTSLEFESARLECGRARACALKPLAPAGGVPGPCQASIFGWTEPCGRPQSQPPR